MRRARAAMLVFAALLAGTARASAPPPPAAAVDSLLGARRVAAAESTARAALGALETAHAPDTLRALMLDALVRVFMDKGSWSDPEARARAEEAVRLKESSYGPNHGETGKSLVQEAILLYRLHQWEAGIPIAERALAVNQDFYGERSRHVIRSIHVLANFCEDSGEFARAEALYQRELAITVALFGPESSQAANTLNSTAILYRKTGRLSEAKPLYERSLALRERTLGSDNLEVAWSYNNYGNLLDELGDFEAARRAFEHSIAIREKVEGPGHPNVATAYSNLGIALLDAGDSTAAERAFLHALEIREKTLAPDHYDIAQSLTNLGMVWSARGEHARADSAVARALAIREKLFGTDNPEYAFQLSIRATLAENRGDAAAAERDYRRACAIDDSAGIGESERGVEALHGLARAELANGKDSLAFDDALRAAALYRARLRNTVRVLEERVALEYAGTRATPLDVALSLIAAEPTPRARAAAAWDAVIASRALVLDEMAERHRAVVTSGDSAVRGLADTVRAARERLARLVVRGPAGSAARYRDQLAAAQAICDGAEARLAERSAAFRDERARSRAGLAAVLGALGRDDALVAYVRFGRLSPSHAAASATPPPEYLAFVARGDGRGPEAVPIGHDAAIDSAVSAWIAEAGRRPGALTAARDEARCREAGLALRRRVWDPLNGAIEGARRVFIVPDGGLHVVNFAALPAERGGYLAERGGTLHLLSTERDLAGGDDRVRGRGMLALGAPDFDRADAGAATLTLASTGAAATGPARAEVAVYRGGQSGCDDFRALRFEPLPASGREVDAVVEAWQRATPGAAALTLTGDKAAETAFKRLAPGRDVLHLATHGFLLGNDCARRGGRSAAASGPSTRESPLLRCGLALAGANQRDAAAADQDDGILTAEEIAALDLTGTRWAVLSACESGRGEVRAAEGVFGLRRAFQIAGAGAVIMSLWAVDDAASSRWMQDLYDARFRRGQDTAEAVRAADLAALRDRRARGLSGHPFFWAGFVAAGDWR